MSTAFTTLVRVKMEIGVFIDGEEEKWTVGITADPDTRKSAHGNPEEWQQWDAGSETNARNIEKHFLAKGCKGDDGGGKNPTYVYIFKK